MERIFVVGALMRNEGLNAKFSSIGARFCIEAQTTPEFRLFLLESRVPPSCGLARVGNGGVSIAGEVWKIPLESWGDLLTDFMVEPECLAWIPLDEEGTKTLGFVLDPHQLQELVDITEASKGSWRVFCEGRNRADSANLFVAEKGSSRSGMFHLDYNHMNEMKGDAGDSLNTSEASSVGGSPSIARKAALLKSVVAADEVTQDAKKVAPGSRDISEISSIDSPPPRGTPLAVTRTVVARAPLPSTTAVPRVPKDNSKASDEVSSSKSRSVVKSAAGPPKADEVISDALIDEWDSVSAERRFKLLSRDVPIALVGKLWFTLSGAARYRQPGVFEAHVNKALSKQVEDVIQRDMHRTLVDAAGLSESEMKTQRKKMHLILKAYANFDPTTGYAQGVQGMNFLVGTLIQYMDIEESYWTLVALMSREGAYRLRSLFKRGTAHLPVALFCLKSLIEMFLPKLDEHFKKIAVSPVMFATPWFLTLFSYKSPLDSTTRVWNLFFEYGKVFLYRFAMATLKLLENECLAMDMEHVVVFLNSPRPDSFAMRAVEESSKFAKIDDSLLRRLKSVAASKIRQDRASAAASSMV